MATCFSTRLLIRFLLGMCAAATCGWLPNFCWAEDSCQLVDARQANEIQRVQVTLDVQGKLRLDQTSQQNAPQAELSANEQLAYHEQVLRCQPKSGATSQSVVTGRFYETAVANIQVGAERDETTLGQEQSIVVANSDADSLISIQTPLSRKELEMLDVPGNSLQAYRLLPNKRVGVGETWMHTDEDLAAVFNLDQVIVNETRSRLVAVERGLARMQIGGTITGNVHGAATELQIAGDYRFDIRWKRINWLQLTIQESRDPSPVRPGFDVKAEMRMLVSPLDKSPQLADSNLTAAVTELDRKQNYLRFESTDGAYRLVHDAQWHVVDDRAISTSLRLVDKGKVIAQSNIRRLKKLEPGKTLGLEEFQSDIQKALGERFGEFETAEKSQRHDGYEILRVAARGSVSEIPIRWVYYHLASPDGERISYVFTMESDAIERFASYDHAMVDSIQLAPVPEPTKTTAEEEQQAARNPAVRR